MTNEHSDKKNRWHLSKSIPITLIATIIAQTFGFGWYMSQLSHTVKQNTNLIQSHHLNKVDHMPYKEKIEVFVPRVEIENRLRSVEQDVSIIRQDVKLLLARPAYGDKK